MKASLPYLHPVGLSNTHMKHPTDWSKLQLHLPPNNSPGQHWVNSSRKVTQALEVGWSPLGQKFHGLEYLDHGLKEGYGGTTPKRQMQVPCTLCQVRCRQRAKKSQAGLIHQGLWLLSLSTVTLDSLQMHSLRYIYISISLYFLIPLT